MKKKILIIDDERELSMILAEMLREEGYEVATAANAFKALALLEVSDYQLILLDVMMPIMNGLELLRKIKGLPKSKNVPVILMSAAQEPEKIKECQWNEFIAKPFGLEDVLQVINKYLREFRAELKL